jgi:uncharacterized protein with PIN domain
MVVDTSAILALLLEEPEAADYSQFIEDDLAPLISAASVHLCEWHQGHSMPLLTSRPT